MPTKRSKAKKERDGKPPLLNSAKEFEELILATAANEHYILRLFITGTTVRSAQAIANIRTLCEECLTGRYDLEVIDIYQQPGIAMKEQIIAAPTLIKMLPLPLKRLIGNLADRDKVLAGLSLLREIPGNKAKATV